jgi:hypothetical protein
MPTKTPTKAIAKSDDIMIRMPDGTVVALGDMEVDENFTPEDDGGGDVRLIIPELKLVTGVSKMDGAEKHAGDFYTTDDETFHEGIQVVPLRMQKTRVMFPADSATPLCMSADGVYPLDGMKLWQESEIEVKGRGAINVPPEPASCDACPFSEWETDDKGNRLRPICNEGLDLLAIRTENGMPARIRLHGTNLAPFRRFYGSRFKPKNKPLLSQTLDLTTRRITEGTNTWYSIVWMGTDNPPRLQAVYNGLLREYRDVFNTTLATVEETTAEPASDATASQWQDV